MSSSSQQLVDRSMDTPPSPSTVTSDYDSITPPRLPHSVTFPRQKCGGGGSSSCLRNNCINHHSTLSDSEDNSSLSSSGKDSGCGKGSKGRENPPQVADLDSSLLWAATLLYHTGLPCPKVKEHHFAPGNILRSTVSMSDMHRAQSPFKRFTKTRSKDSGTGDSVGVPVDNEDPEGEQLPGRKRNASCSSSTSSTRVGIMGRIKNTNSLRILKTSRPSLSSFMEKTQSLPRQRKARICEEAAAAAAKVDDIPYEQPNSASSSSSGGLRSARKALRDSFRAARSFLPSSSKVSPTKTKKNNDELSYPKSDNDCDQTRKEDNNSSVNTHNDPPTNSSSAPSTPKESRLKRARKKFASTLSLRDAQTTSGCASSKSKSTSTLQICDSEGTTVPHGVIQAGLAAASSISTESLLAVLEDPGTSLLSKKHQPNTAVVSSTKSKSPFRFISRSKKESQQEKNETLGLSQQPSPDKDTEKPPKKRMSIVKSIGKAIRRGNSTSRASEANQDPSVIVNKTFAGEAAEARSDRTQEILRFDNEPRVRTPKAPQRHRFRSASTATTSTSVSLEDKDREIHEVEVSETAIDISPEKGKLSECESPLWFSGKLGGLQKTHEHGTPPITRGTNVDRDDYDGDHCDVNDCKVESAQSNNTQKGRSTFDKEGEVGEEVKKKTKSQSLITPLVSSSSGRKSRMDVERDNKTKSKKSSGKKAKKKLGAREPESQSNNNSVTTKNEEISSEACVEKVGDECIPNGNNKTTESVLLGKSAGGDENLSRGLSGVDSTSEATSNRRKSSEDFKDSRKNAAHSNGTLRIPEGLCLNGKLDNGRMIESNYLSNDSGNTDVDQNINCGSNATGLGESERRVRSGSEYYNEQFKEIVGLDGTSADADLRNALTENNEVDNETDDPETACTASFRQLKPFNYDLEPIKEGKKERLYKVLVVGELGAGKTSIIKRYVHQFFSQHYRATIGVDFALKVLRWDPDTVVRLQLWDIAGQERFGSMTRVYYKEAVGAFVVFDVTRSATLEAVPKWKADLDAKVALPDGRPIPTVLLANKSDQPKEGIAANREKMNEFCQQQGFSAWFETSAKDNINIDESANFLVSKILEMDKWSQEPLAPDPDKLDITANGKHSAASASNCAC